VLLDAQVYEDLEGRWVDLFNRMKWDIIKSVLKSVAGLQGRKFKVQHNPRSHSLPKTQHLHALPLIAQWQCMHMATFVWCFGLLLPASFP